MQTVPSPYISTLPQALTSELGGKFRRAAITWVSLTDPLTSAHELTEILTDLPDNGEERESQEELPEPEEKVVEPMVIVKGIVIEESEDDEAKEDNEDDDEEESEDSEADDEEAEEDEALEELRQLKRKQRRARRHGNEMRAKRLGRKIRQLRKELDL
jgi:hypothetical protein